MGDPMSMVSMGASALGGIFGAAGAKTKAAGEQLNIQGQMIGTMGKAFSFDVESANYKWKSGVEEYQAQVARNNKLIAEQNANYERDVGEVTAQQLGMKQQWERGQMMAQQGASGLSV